ncbi:MAG: hypothetical protein SO314_04210 [Alphaproteobacteria bacterium]|nr:hypothetical protein [Alphaproteobacteria bacterium]
MKILKNIMIRSLLAAVFCIMAVCASQALIPVFDRGTMMQCLGTNLKVILESKFVVNIMNTEGNMNTTMGTAKSNFFNFLNTGIHSGDGNEPNGEYDQDYDHLPNNKVPSAGDAKMNLIKDLGASLDPRKSKIQLADLSGTATISGSSGIASAKAVNEEYSGLYSTEDGDKFIFPDAMADYCEINVDDINTLDKKVKMIECLKKRFRFQISPRQSDQAEARDIFYKSVMEEAYANIAEALVTRNFAVYYEKEILKPLSKKAIKAQTERDDYATTMIMNKEIARILNKLYNVYAMQLSYNMFAEYGNFEPFQEELEDKPEDPNPQGTKDKIMIIPRTLAEFCSLDADTAGKMENKEKVEECLKSLIALREQPTQSAKHEAREIFIKSVEQQNYAFFAEALLARLYSIDYEKDVLQPVENKAIESTTVKLDYDTVLKANKEIANMLARIMNVYTMKVANDTFQYYGEYEIIREQLLNID